MLYVGIALGVFASTLLVLAGMAIYRFVTFSRGVAIPDKMGSVPFMRRKSEVRKPKVNDDRRALEIERKQAERR